MRVQTYVVHLHTLHSLVMDNIFKNQIFAVEKIDFRNWNSIGGLEVLSHVHVPLSYHVLIG